MEKDDARKEAIRLWRALPAQQHRNHKQATAFAKTIAPLLPFDTLGDHDKIVEGWLQQDLIASDEAARRFSQKLATAPSKNPKREPATTTSK